MNKILQFILLHGYALLFSWSFLAQFGLPLPGARHLPLERIEENPQIFPPDRDIVFYCS
jgi:hypothetical protein